MCFCEDGNELMVSISGKEFIVRSVYLRMESWYASVKTVTDLMASINGRYYVASEEGLCSTELKHRCLRCLIPLPFLAVLL